MPLTQFAANKLIDHQLGKTAYTLPTIYVGVSSTTPTVAGANVTEPSTGAYARVATSGATWNASAAGATSNASVITFPAATADWLSAANITYGLLYDAATAGNLIGFGLISGTPAPVVNGTTLSIAAAGLTLTLS